MRQEESAFRGGLANPQRGVSSCSSPAPLPRGFSSANSLMLLPKGKPKIHGQEDELQWQRSCFVFDCSKQLWDFSPCYIGGSYILLCCLEELEELGELSWLRCRGAQHPALSWMC